MHFIKFVYCVLISMTLASNIKRRTKVMIIEVTQMRAVFSSVETHGIKLAQEKQRN